MKIKCLIILNRGHNLKKYIMGYSKEKEAGSSIGNLIRNAGIVQVVLYAITGGLIYEGAGAVAGGIIGLICCFFFYGFAVIVDAAQKYIDLNSKEEPKKKTETQPTTAAMSAWEATASSICTAA